MVQAVGSARGSKRQPVPVDADLYEKYRTYSKLTGIPVAVLVRRALQQHYDVTLTSMMESMQQNCPGGDVQLQPGEVPDTPLERSATFTADDAMSPATVLDAQPVAPGFLPDSAAGALPDWAADS